MSVWNYAYFFASGQRRLQPVQFLETIEKDELFSEYDGPAYGLVVDEEDLRTYKETIKLGDNPSNFLKKLLNEGQYFSISLYGKPSPLHLTFNVGESYPHIRNHITMAWSAKSNYEVDPIKKNKHRKLLHQCMKASRSTHTIFIQEPGENFEDHLVEIDGNEFFDNQPQTNAAYNQTRKPYSLSALWVDESYNPEIPKGIQLKPSSKLSKQTIEYLPTTKT